MDKIFKDQIRRNLEVYEDDISVKSKSGKSHPQDLEETFSNLRKFGVKIKPSKCTFGVKEGKFLRYVIKELVKQAKVLKQRS